MPYFRVRGLQTLDCEWWVKADSAGDAETAIEEGKLEPQNVVDVHDVEIEEVTKIAQEDAINPHDAELYV